MQAGKYKRGKVHAPRLYVLLGWLADWSTKKDLLRGCWLRTGLLSRKGRKGMYNGCPGRPSY